MKVWVVLLIALLVGFSLSRFAALSAQPPAPDDRPNTAGASIDTSFENASPLHWETDADGAMQVHLIYDKERSSFNRASGHWHFRLRAKPGSRLTVVINDLDNVWNGKRASPATDRTISFLSTDGRNWRAVPTKLLVGH